MTAWEITYWSFRLPSFRRLMLVLLFQSGQACIYTYEAMMECPRHELSAAFGRN